MDLRQVHRFKKAICASNACGRLKSAIRSRVCVQGTVCRLCACRHVRMLTRVALAVAPHLHHYSTSKASDRIHRMSAHLTAKGQNCCALLAAEGGASVQTDARPLW